MRVFTQVLTVAVLACSMHGSARADDLPWLHQGQAAHPAAQGATPSQSQALPWLQQPANSSKQHTKAKPAPAPAVSSAEPATRETDDRKLNQLAGEYYHISSKDAHAATRLASLQKRVKAFHAALKKRDYDVADIIKDTAKLESRIAITQKKVASADVDQKSSAAPSAK